MRITSTLASTMVEAPLLPTRNTSDVFDFEPNDETPLDASASASIPQSEEARTDNTMTLAKALELLETKDTHIASLEGDLRKLRSDCEHKDALISQQSKELQRLHERECQTLTLSDMDDGFLEHDPHQLDKVIGDLTSDIETPPAAKRTKRSSLIPIAILPTITEDNNNSDPVDLEGTQDSLSFPGVPHRVQSVKKLSLVEENRMLRTKLSLLAATYYHWKVACILSVDRSQQVAAELDKVSKNFVANKPKRENGLTSWALMDDMFPTNMPMLEVGGNEVIDWARNGWDHENCVSSHVHEKSRKPLWPNPASFVLDHTKCPICLEPFGPEGGWALGSCKHVYHPQCLITHCLIRRRCVICAAPFHDRLYAMFNLMTYMPPSWEHSIDTTTESRLWGKDLLWSWREGVHDQEMGSAASQLNWETDPAEILRVAFALMGKGPQNEGKRSFFFQCLGGYFDKTTRTFKWGAHPNGHRWNLEGQRGVNRTDQTSVEDLTSMAYLDSSYGPYYQSQAVDYLLELHSPQTKRTLEALKDSNVLQSILKANGPAARTRAKRKLQVQDSEHYERGEASASEVNPVET
jgi:hypothetical protein